MAYLPIDQYGVIGDLHTAALVGRNGSIDWLCLPRFDSPSLFGAILDDKIGGRFKISVVGEAASRQMYVPDTNVLVTRFVTKDGVACIDFHGIGSTSGKAAHAVVQGDKMLVSTNSDKNGFEDAWKKHCLGPRGGTAPTQ